MWLEEWEMVVGAAVYKSRDAGAQAACLRSGWYGYVRDLKHELQWSGQTALRVLCWLLNN